MPNRNAETFADLLRLLQGYPLNIRDETHRQELLRDARYFHFKGLEQKLMPHTIAYNSIRGHDEITLRLENVQKSGISVLSEHNKDPAAAAAASDEPDGMLAMVNYARPYIDDKPAELVLEIGGETSRVHFFDDGPRVEFFRDTKIRVAKLLEVIATKLNLPPTTQPLGLLMASGGASSQPATPGNTPLSEDLVRASLEPESAIVLDGKDYQHFAPGSASLMGNGTGSADTQSRKRQRTDGAEQDSWTITTGQWRLRVRTTNTGKSAVECVLVAVRLEGVSSEQGRNKMRRFLVP